MVFKIGEIMLIKGYSKKSIATNIKKEKASGKSTKQSVAIALSVAKKQRRQQRKNE